MRVSDFDQVKILKDFYNQLPLGVLVEDYSLVKQKLDDLRQKGITDLRKYLIENPDVLFDLVWSIEIIDANESLLKMTGVKTLQEYLEFEDDANIWESSEWRQYYLDEIICFTEGKTYFADMRSVKADGTPFDVRSIGWVPEDHQNDWSVVLSTQEDITESLALRQRLKDMSRTDPLTGLLNRKEFEVRTEQSLERIQRAKDMLAVMFIDLDNFKDVNDTYGHHIGDQALIETAVRLNNIMRKTDTIGRMGGDEFVICLEGGVTKKNTEKVAQKVLSRLAKPLKIDGGTKLRLGASIGIAYSPTDSLDVKELLIIADKAMYNAKKRGKHQFA